MSILIVGLLLGLFIAWVTNGDLRRLENVPLKHWWLFVVAALLQVVIFLPGVGARLGGLVPVLYVASFLIVLIGLALNWRTKGLALAAAGVGLNLITIVANGGYMPVSRAAAEGAGLVSGYSPVAGRPDALVHANSLLAADVRIAFLGDVLWFKLGRLGSAFSVGDVLLAAGICWLVVAYSRRPAGRHRAAGRRTRDRLADDATAARGGVSDA